MGDETWSWDPTLYAGSAAYYARGRLPYPPEVAEALGGALGLDGTGRLLDVGCGPGSLTLLLAPRYDGAVGVDADPAMVRAAERLAVEAKSSARVDFLELRAEQLPGGLGTFRTVTFAQSFHWMDQVHVAERARAMLAGRGAVVHLGATTHEGAPPTGALPHPTPPRPAIGELIRSFLGPVRRAGRHALATDPPDGEDQAFASAGLRGPERLEVGGGAVFERSEDDIVASVFSVSFAAPHLFGDELGRFERELRALLRQASPSGRFSEVAAPVGLTVWWA